MLCCQTLPAMLSVESGFNWKLCFGLCDVYWLCSVYFPGTRVSIGAVMGARWHVAAP